MEVKINRNWYLRPWSIAFLIFIALIIIAGVSTNKSKQAIPVTQNTQQTQVEPTPTPIPIEKVNIIISSQIVKKVDKKYRYFFDISNKDTKSFEGNVTIGIYNDKLKSALAEETFTTQTPIEPNWGRVVYLDANTGPVSQHGDYGMTKYKYVVKTNGIEINNGEGKLTDTFEDMDAYSF